MIPISPDHPIRFFVEHLVHRRAGTDLVPHTRLGLQVETDLIGGFESSFGRTPRMEPHVVQAPTLARLKKFSPVVNICGRITRERKVAAAVRTAKDDRSAIEYEFFSHCSQSTQANLHVVILIDAGSL